MDGPIPALLCDVSFFKSLEGLFVIAIFFGGREGIFWNSILVAIIAHDSCSNRRVKIHL